MAGTESVTKVWQPKRFLPFPIYSAEKLSALDWSRLKQVVVSLHLNADIKPVAAVAGSPGRTLAIGSPPPWVGNDWIGIYETSSEDLRSAVKWVLVGDDHPKAHYILDNLRDVYGPNLREITDDS